MATTITMPKLGLTMNSGSVQEWKKKTGEKVKKGELLYVVATDKLTVDVESPADGVLLAITVEIGQDVPIGAPIGIIGAPGEKFDVPAAPQNSQPAAQPAQAPAREISAPGAAASAAVSGAGGSLVSNSPKAASPKAKKLAREKGVDLTALKGTGPNGWIVASDVLNAAGTSVKASPTAAKMAAEAGVSLDSFGLDRRVMKADVQHQIQSQIQNQTKILSGLSGSAGGSQSIPVTPMRRVIGERMFQSHVSIPSVSYFSDVDMSALNELRAAYNERRKGAKVSVNDILMKLCAKLLMENPMVNASAEISGDGKVSAFVLHNFVNIGFAVALPGPAGQSGLLVPNVKNVQDKSAAQIAEERAELVEKARKGGLAPEHTTGGTFTISNLGMIGVGAFTPIINPPEAAILGVGTTIDKPVAVDGAVVIRPMAVFCLTADHRLVDGAEAAAFLSSLKELVERPGLFLF